MKYVFVLIAIVIAFSLAQKDKHSGGLDRPCKIEQRYYLKGKLVHVQDYDSIITERGCLNYFSVKGKATWADSIVTTLK